jgi:hypothetical protein
MSQQPDTKPIKSRVFDKRSVFFFLAAILCGLLIPLTPATHRDVGIVLVLVYLVLSVASWLDFRSNG